MKTMKKMISILLVTAMILSLGLTALAADTPTYTITINNEVDGYTYLAYQIFKGDYSNGTLSNIEWGEGINSTNFLAALKTATETTGNALYGKFTITDSTTATNIASAMTESNGFKDNSDAMKAFAELAQKYVDDSKAVSFSYDSTTKTYKSSAVTGGYYLVVNTAVPSGDDTSYSRYMVRVVGDANINPKSSVPESSKEVGDVNDSTDLSTADPTYGSTADYDIGDNVPFKLTAKLPSTYGDYSAYKIVFHDTMSTGLSLNSSSFEVTILDNNGNTVATIPKSVDISGITYTNYTVTTPGTETQDPCTFELVFEDLNNIYDSNGNKVTMAAEYRVIVDYTAKLLDTAAYKETNKMYLEYSNNPYSTSTGTTPEDIVTVFTFDLVVSKYGDATDNPLKGASFTLYKYDADTSTYVKVTEIAGTDTNVFTFNGLDDGRYMLSETVTPAGYNTIDDIYFVVEATHSENADGTTNLSMDVYQTDASGNALTTQSQTFSVTATTGTITTSIINHSGSGLPITGGIGTTIFYIVGAALVIGAGVLLIVKRRMRGVQQ